MVRKLCGALRHFDKRKNNRGFEHENNFQEVQSLKVGFLVLAAMGAAERELPS
jgi:hypothetical protein